MNNEETPLGVPLSTYQEDLYKVPDHLNDCPVRAFDGMSRIGSAGKAYVEEREGSFDQNEIFQEIAHRLPIEVFNLLSFDEMCKVNFSKIHSMRSCVSRAFEENPSLRVFEKIKSSLWRWGYSSGKWNEIVDAYNGIRSFDIDVADFEVRFDHTTYYNEKGYSEHSRTYLDGAMAFLLLYKGRHVMTVGFSVMGDRRLLLQQVQLVENKGNRWLFKFPQNRIEYIIDRLILAFPCHKLLIADGASYTTKTLLEYQKSLENAEGKVEIQSRYFLHCGNTCSESAQETLKYWIDKAEDLTVRITHLSNEANRIIEFYDDLGRYARGEPIEVNGLLHHQIEQPTPKTQILDKSETLLAMR